MNKNLIIEFSIKKIFLEKTKAFISGKMVFILTFCLGFVSIAYYIHYLNNGLGLSYNDARSHLDIGRRVVEGLKPGLAQLGSVWLPLPHLLIVASAWNDFMWHSGLSGAIISMISFVTTGLLIYKFLEKIGVHIVGRLIGVLVFVANLNVLYLQSTAMTELLLLATMTAGVYYLVVWALSNNILDLIKSSFWIMLSTLVRYDGWFFFLFATILIAIKTIKERGYKVTEGLVILFCTLAGFGIVLWFFWNLIIFKDPLYFAFGPFSARAQQSQLESAGILSTKGNLIFSLKIYLYALLYNSTVFTAFLGLCGGILFFVNKKIKGTVRLMSVALITPFIFNVMALYFGHSVLFIQGLTGTTWFNARYGIMLMPSIAIFIGFLVDRIHNLRPTLLGLLVFVTFFAFVSGDAVTIDDARVGSSQKNVSEVAGYLHDQALNEKGFILISAASHDAIIFSSGL